MMAISKFRRQSPELMRARFQWLNQVLIDPELPASAFKVAYRISDGFNDIKSDGRAWESGDEIAKAIGMSQPTVVEMVRRLHARKHLRVEWGQRGRGHSNNYWLTLKDRPADVFGTIKDQPADEKAQPADMNQRTNEATPVGGGGEREAAAQPPSGARPSVPSGHPSGKKKKEKAGCSVGLCCSEELAALRGTWVREHHVVADNKPAAIEAQQRALDTALQDGASFDVIMTGCKNWAAAYDADNNGRRFLPSLSDWLSSQSWEKPPPKRKQAKGANGNSHWHGRRRGNSASASDEILEAAMDMAADMARRAS